MGANTVTYGQGYVIITPHSTFNTDFSLDQSKPGLSCGMRLKMIKFIPGTVGDELIIRDKSASGAIISDLPNTPTEGVQDPGMEHIENFWYPYIAAGDHSGWANPQNARITFLFEPV